MNDKTPNRKNTEGGNAPEIVLRDGPLRAAAWRVNGEYGPQYNTKVTRYYKGDDGDIRETSTLRERDLLPAAELASEMHRVVRDRKREQKQERSQDGQAPREADERQRFKKERSGSTRQRRKPRDRSAR